MEDIKENGVEAEEENRMKKSNENEQHKLGLMRSFVESQDPTSKEVDDMTLRRFLHARDLDNEKASSMFLKYLKWRREFVPNGTISESEISNDLAHKIFFLQGVDKYGHPIGVVFPGKHFPNGKVGADQFKRTVVYFLDKLCLRMPRGQEQFTVIADLQGWGYSNCDIRAYIGAISILQDCYPERLGKLLLVNVPYIFMQAWKLICPIIDKNTSKKIAFVEKKKMTSILLQDIDKSQLPQVYGGHLQLVLVENA
ncbi:hypothetical protein IFM89_009099 [Coptis chinensis]|uniref:CRAL-TRIO domain-containing protein n=1 Tax=Coptis chinensis TaxID=261450 RepID=A0A835IP49_9MAGN|nr:hypothetical protein IFM89_009099 [Coptis chinensis]